MNNKRLIAVSSLLGFAAALHGGVAQAAVEVKARLSGLQEIPAVSTQGSGTFTARLSGGAIIYTLSYRDLNGDVLQAHIHFGQAGANGGISAFLCSNLGNGPAGTQTCPAAPATISGTITAADVVGPSGQGINAGEFEELLDAIDAGATYANVHSSPHPGGELRGQIGPGFSNN